MWRVYKRAFKHEIVELEMVSSGSADSDQKFLIFVSPFFLKLKLINFDWNKIYYIIISSGDTRNFEINKRFLIILKL